jgi:hypothetical protein
LDGDIEAAVAGEGVAEAGRLDAAQLELSAFFTRNPLSKLEIKSPESGGLQIGLPWGDASISIQVPEDRDDLVEALNACLLPERYSAIYHTDSKKLEVIYTAYELVGSQKDLTGRKFNFLFKGRKHECQFSASSKRLLAIAKNALPQGTTLTTHRNIMSFHHYTNMGVEGRELFSIVEPWSFWISNVTWNEAKVFELISNLNFYLTYYDDMSPTVLIHPPTIPTNASSRRTRYIHGAFPEIVNAQGLNDHLLGFWQAADTGNPTMRFILYYRIIEYAAHHYVDDDIKRDLRKLLLSPHLTSDVPAAIEKITDIMSAKKLEDIPKFRAIVEKCVDPKLIWREAQANKAFFSKETKFNGGFVIKALLSDDEKEAAFGSRGLDHFCTLLRKIRNALSHGRDQETGGVITATPQNFNLLRPWVHLIGTAAGEVVLFKDLS